MSWKIENMMKTVKYNSVCSTLSFAAYFMYQYVTCKESRYMRRPMGKVVCVQKTRKKLSELNIAIVSDELTYVNFFEECHLYKVTPHNWQNVFQTNEIDIFFCESAWEGCREQQRCWRGRVYKNHSVKFETRKALFDILDYCERADIPTIFWNKEDPTFFGNDQYDFVDTALHFRYVFTTAQECIKRYKEKGHERVYLMMFGFEPSIYNPKTEEGRSDTAVFAGSWYGEDRRRCEIQQQIFRIIIDSGINLKIFDRQSDSRKQNRRYPEEFQAYVHSAVSQETLGQEIKKSRYAININTVTDSETMFARRVYELMASGVYIISNASKAMNKKLRGRYSEAGDGLPDDIANICRCNVDYVFQNHTNKIRLDKMLSDIGYPIISEKWHIEICGNEKVIGNVEQSEKMTIRFVDNLNMISEDADYFIIWKGYELPALERMVAHFSYINPDCGIRIDDRALYQIVVDTENTNVLFSKCMLKQLQENIHKKIKKYNI